MSESFHVNFKFPGPVVLKLTIFKDFSYITGPLVLEKKIFKANTCKNGFRYRGLTRPTGAMILTNIYLHNVGKLPYKFQLSWPSGSGEEDFQSFFLYKHM